jgi:hypothetical protein
MMNVDSDSADCSGLPSSKSPKSSSELARLVITLVGGVIVVCTAGWSLWNAYRSRKAA